MFGLVKVHSGSVTLGDRDITNVRTNRLVEMGVGFVPQTNNVFPSLTIEENLRMGLFMRPKKVGGAARRDVGPVPGAARPAQPARRCAVRAVSGSRWRWRAR